jgi:hypothetical protein
MTENQSNSNDSNWLSWGDGFIEQEKKVWKNNLPLAITTSIATAVYSYTMIDKSTNNAINRGLLMTLSSLLGATVVDVASRNGYLDADGNGPMVAETLVVPLLYYWVNKRQFQFPDLESQVIKTAVIGSIAGQLLTPQVTKYLNSMTSETENKKV